MTVTVDTILVQESEPIGTTVGDEMVLLSIRAGAYFSLSAVGSEIWSMLDKPRRVGEVCDRLSQLYDADQDIVTRDVTSFLQALIGRGLLPVV